MPGGASRLGAKLVGDVVIPDAESTALLPGKVDAALDVLATEAALRFEPVVRRTANSKIPALAASPASSLVDVIDLKKRGRE